jgi:DNA-binding MarR family transcriptional regulator
MPVAASPPDLATEDFLHLAQIVMRAVRDTNFSSWCDVDLTMPQLKALFLAHTPGGACHGQIARALGVGVSTVTGIVDRLVERGLVERHTDTDDRRLSHVVITPAGVDLLDRLWASGREQLGALLGNLTPDERTAFVNALQHLATLLAPGEGEHA